MRPDRHRLSRAGRAIVLVSLIGFGLPTAAALAADLPSYDVPAYVVRPAPRPQPYVYVAPPVVVDPAPPASEHGYYGYYGFDIAGTPYNGLYSANVLCLRSIRTPYGYETVNVCRPDR